MLNVVNLSKSFRSAQETVQVLRGAGLAVARGESVALTGESGSGKSTLLHLIAGLDEPTAGVDPKARRDFWDEIRRLSATGVTVLVSTHYMDEAVQCDFIAYIAYGRKLISGPARDIPRMVGLHTWVIEGGDIAAMEASLRADPGVAQVARFGSVLHVSSPDEAGLQAAVARHPGNWQRLEGGLEEAFIWLMSGAQDNFAGGQE